MKNQIQFNIWFFWTNWKPLLRIFTKITIELLVTRSIHQKGQIKTSLTKYTRVEK